MNAEFSTYLPIAAVTLLPLVFTIIIISFDASAYGKKTSYWTKQLVIGILFGVLAILGTELGIHLNGAVLNARDGAVLTAGLLFGAPAGILAGLIGGIERWFSVYWGVGSFTRVACSVSTSLAGFYCLFINRYLLEERRPSWVLALIAGAVFEVFHLTMVFFTHPYETTEAMLVIKSCSTPLVLMNSFAVALACFAHNHLSKDLYHYRPRTNSLPVLIQKRLAIVIVVCFLFSASFVSLMERGNAQRKVESLVTTSLTDVKNGIFVASDENLIAIAEKVKADLKYFSLEQLAERYFLSEISLIDEDGIITASTTPSFVGYDMSSGAQSSEFNVLLNGENSFAQSYGPISYDESIYRKYAGVALSDGGYLQVGYNSEYFQNDIRQQIKSAVRYRHVGENGYILVADENFVMVYAPDSFGTLPLNTYVDLSGGRNITKQTIFDEDYYVSIDQAEGFYIAVLVEVAEIDDTTDALVVAGNFMQIIVFAIMFAITYILMRKSVLNNLASVDVSLKKIADGELDERIDIHDSDEFSSLSTSINSTVKALKGYIDQAKARIDEELGYARSIQTSALSHTFPDSSSFEIYADSKSAKEVGGDFYDFLRISKRRLAFSIADVSGKGIPGALFMMRSKSTLRSYTERNLAMDEVFTLTNDRLCEGNDASMFVTAWQGVIDLATGEIEYANAGHNPPIIRRANGETAYLESRPGFVLAGMDGVLYHGQKTKLEPGDMIYIYTDGVVEAHNPAHELYGEERLLKLIRNMDPEESMEAICKQVYADVELFADGYEQFDDITMLALRYKGVSE